MLHGRDLGLTVFDFLNDLQTTTKNPNEGTLDLVRRVKLPNFLLANTHAKRVATEVADYDDNGEDEIWRLLHSQVAATILSRCVLLIHLTRETFPNS